MDGLRLRVNNESVRGPGFRHDHALAGLQALNTDFSVGVGPVNTVAVTDQSSVRVGDFELGVLEGNAGIYGTNLPDKEQSVRCVVKGDSDYILHAVVGDIDRFRGIDDRIPICGVNFLHDIGARSEARPDAGSVFPRHFLPDDGAARSAGSAQETELEGAAGQGLSGHAVVFLDHDPVEGLILEGEGLALAAANDDLLRGRLLHLETGGGLYLRHGVLARIELLALFVELDLSTGVREEVPEVHGGRGIGGFSVAGVGHMEFRPLDRSARNRIFLENSQLRGLVVAEHQRLFIAGIQTDRLYPVFVLVGQVIGGGDGLLRDLVGAGGNPQGNRSVRPGGPVVLIVAVDGLDSEHGAGNGLAAVGVDLGNGQLRLLQILEDDFLLIAAVQADGLRGFLADAVGLRDRLLCDPVAAGGKAQFHGAAGLGSDFMAVIAVNGLQEKDGARDGLIGPLLNFGDFQKGLLLVIKNELLAVSGLQPNCLGRFVADNIGVRDGNLRDLVRIHRDARQGGGAVRPGGHVMVKAVVDALDLKVGIGDHVSRLGVPFQDREVRELLVGGGDSDGAAPVDGGLIHMGNDRLGELGPGSRDGNLHKGVHSLGHVRHRDGAVRLGFLGADDLAVLDDIEYSAGEGIAAVVQLHQADLHLGVILEDQGNVRLAVPNESLFDFVLVRALGIALRRGHFLRHIAAGGHGVPGNIGDIAALPAHKGAGKVVVYASNLDNGSGEAPGGVVRVHFTDTALSGNGGGVPEGDSYRVVAVAGEDDILRPGVVDLILRGRVCLRHGVGAGGQVLQGGRSVAPGGHVLGEGAAFGFDVKLRPGEALAGVGGIHLLDDQGVAVLGGDFQLSQDDLLDAACGVCAGTRAGEAVLVGRTLAPHPLISQV